MNWHFIRKGLSQLLLLPLLSCANAQLYPQQSLSREILMPRLGHDGKLTNQACLQYNLDKCMSWGIKEYDLANPAFRDTANAADFICNVSGKRYKICKDKPGFCRIGYQCSRVLGICSSQTEIETDYIPAIPYQKILDLNVKCFNQSVYSWVDVH